VVHDSRYPCEDNKEGLEGACAYKYQMPFLSSFVEKPGVSRVFRYVADAPTTTTQRLKSMTSGSLPIFFDISNAFSASAMDEDNLIDQFVSAGKRLVFMGDSTWSGLYPTQFNVSHPFPCYNIMDLHTVDDGIGKLLIPTIENESWDVLVAHYLGVDHAGHAHGVESEAMMSKLRQIDSNVKHVVDVLRQRSYPGGPFEDTLVLVGGDHGQTLTGDHGGGSPEEVDSALIAIDINAYRDEGDGSVEKQQCEKDCSCGQDGNQCVEDLMQIDLVPTLAGLMRIPIPFINLGKVSKQLWSLAGPARCGVSSYEQILRENSKQVFQYLTTYASMPGARFPDTDLKRLSKAYNSLNDDEESHTEFLIMTEKLARSAWTQFHDGWMIGGGLLYLAIVIFIGSVLVQIILNMERQISNGYIENTVSGRATLVWLANLVHPAGIFSFFFLLNEGWCISYLFAALVLLVTILEIVMRRAHVLHLVKGALMSVVSCFIVSKYGIQTHSGFGFWQRLTQHESSESHALESSDASWVYPAWLPQAKDLTHAIDPHDISFLVQYAIPMCLLVYISSKKFKECRHASSQTIFR
jgi:phosphatidylinositol glycan class O